MFYHPSNHLDNHNNDNNFNHFKQSTRKE